MQTDAEKDLPNSLKCFLDNVIKPGKKTDTLYEKKILTIGHAIISTTRPHSFISNVLLGIGVFVHKKFGSKMLNQVNSCGFLASYTKVHLYEEASISNGAHIIDTDAFSQFVYDNADFNVKSLDGSMQCCSKKCPCIINKCGASCFNCRGISWQNSGAV